MLISDDNQKDKNKIDSKTPLVISSFRSSYGFRVENKWAVGVIQISYRAKNKENRNVLLETLECYQTLEKAGFSCCKWINFYIFPAR